ncbi:MAG: RNA methylase [archaeon GW2011_AR20]|nr:MAG: RNA methylase [archaeon GW2011_AR20]MBS3160655.1 hypothetical protein [Candidatus Woesearchaeota archaeon]
MEEYLFVLGRDKELSLLELLCYFSKKNIKYEMKGKWINLVIFSTDKNNFDIDELGGTIKIAKIIFKKGNEENLMKFLREFEIPNKNKIYYSVNDDLIKETLSKRFKEEEIKAYYKRNVQDPSDALKLDLELIFFKNYLAKVIQVSNPKIYKKRDEVRPRFDEKKVISIRLAKILINLSQAKKEILDPFCGAGTMLQEALLMNLDAYGLDVNIKEARDNLLWLSKNFKVKNKIKLIQGDSRNLSRYIKNIEAVVTEPYLGPYLKTYPNEEEARNIISRLNLLYLRVFQELSKITNKIVIILPVILTRNRRRLNIDIKNLLRNTNFKIANSQLPIIYKHKGSILEREIWIFNKQKL